MRSFVSLNLNSLVSSAFCSLIFVISVFAQSETSDKPNIAVLPFTESGRATYGGSDLTDMLTKELTEGGKFAIADKSKAAAVEWEVKKGKKGTIDPSIVAEIALKTGARYLVLGTVQEFSERVRTTEAGAKSYDAIIRFSFSGVDAATGKVIFSQTIENRGVSLAEVKKITGNFVSMGMQDAISKSVKDAVATVVKHLVSSPSVTK